jgi:hypothetical protein
MSCPYCNREFGHDYRCPNYCPKKAHHYCSICNEGIYTGEEYVENCYGDIAHYECFTDFTANEMLKWLDIHVRTMEEGDDG